MPDEIAVALIFLLLFAIVGLYFLPTLVAVHRRRQVFYVLFVNLFFGMTIVGWLIALRMATYPRPSCPHCDQSLS